MIYVAVIDDFSIQGLSRHKVREHVNRLIGMTKGQEAQHVKQQAGETRAQRYARLAAENADMPERIG